MHLAARRGLWCASSKLPARFIASCRRPTPRAALRHIHSSSHRTISIFPWSGTPKPTDQDQLQPAAWNNEHSRWQPITSPQNLSSAQEVAELDNTETNATGNEPTNSGNGNGSGERDKSSHYGSALRRSMRRKKPKEIPPVPIPFEFLSLNVRRHKYDGALTKGVLHLTGKDEHGIRDTTKEVVKEVDENLGLTMPAQIGSSAEVRVTDQPVNTTFQSTGGSDVQSTKNQAHQESASELPILLNEAPRSADLDAVLVKFYASLQECSQAYIQMEETYGPPGEDLENWEHLPDKWSEMPNLATKYERLAAEFEEIANEAFAAFPDGELAMKVSSEPELGQAFGKHVKDLESALHEVTVQTSSDVSSLEPKPATQAVPQSTEYFPQYALNRALFDEVLASIAAGLWIPRNAHADVVARQKPHLKLFCPIDGGIFFLDKVVEEAATRLGADVTVLDPQDLAEMASEYIREGSEPSGNALWSLGYDVAQIHTGSTSVEPTEEEAEGEESAEEFGERDHGFSPKIGSLTAIPLSAAPREMQNVIKKFFSGSGDVPFASMAPQGPQSGWSSFPIQLPAPKPSNTQNNDAKLSLLLDTVVEANLHKRDFLKAERRRILSSFQSKWAEQGVGVENQRSIGGSLSVHHLNRDTPSIIPLQGIQQFGDQSSAYNSSTQTNRPPKHIVLLRDFKELRSTSQGVKVIDKLVEIIQKKRQEGQQVMLVGTSSSANLAENVSFNSLENLQREDANSAFRTLAVTPDTHRGLYYEEERRRLREVNYRNLFAMLKRLDPARQGVFNKDYEKQGSRAFSAELHQNLEHTQHAATLEEEMLSLDEAHRIMFMAMGQRNLETSKYVFEPKIEPRHIATAMDLINKSDEVKLHWAQDEFQIQNPTFDSNRKEVSSNEARLKKLRKTCDAREKTLLRGVINPENLNTTFDDVHAAPETIEALKTMTTLSLTRPEAFKYGVLAKDKLSGLLLYGPPGTGKTLLAKAVAKQSSAVMLEVSGSDLYDMYVGEGEKNVRAVFSLAKKLAPCVVFIDEADAIFASRGSGTSRNSHRELINQFLREWDGMNETSAFIMVATNRPFDLDDAALRRLPRRLLVDLPSEKDREAILGIHLKDEIVDSSVALAKLASQTPLYSGSDLKNVAVAAALAAVREENDEAGKHTGSEPYQYPEKRTLSSRHFDKAMEEISASVNEDMSSLGAIRKFDEKYGDRRGRRKKAVYGFSPDSAAKEENAKVRT